MSSENVAAEVAEDFKLALEDMTSISRVEIMNLCQIAREHTEHAYEISEVLVAHINRTAPQRKLASLYVLDAIVKNVGTPYTLYVAPKLYSTFMESYARVDHPVRRKMEEMLKTWKGPVPGSMDTKPVFPPDVVLPIETALIKVHTSMQANRKPQPHLRQQPGHRNTPTPPGMNHASGPYPTHTPPNANGMPSSVPQSQAPFQPPMPGAVPAAANHSSLPYYGRDALAGAQQQQQQQQPGYGASAGVNADVLNRDIEDLIVASRLEFAQNPHDGGIQTRLKALVDLQGIVRARNLPQDQLVLVKKQVDELSVKMRAPAAPLPAQVGSGVPLASHVTPPPPPHHHLSRPSSAAPQIPTPAPTSSTPVAAGQAPPLSIDSILGKGALAALLAQQAAAPSRHATPTPAVQTPPPPPASAPAAPAASNPMDIIQQLRQAGLLGSAPTAPPPQAPPAPAVPALSALASLPPVLANALAPMNRAAPPPPPPEDPRVISWSASSLRVVRPYLFSSLHTELGPQCSQCGRRFKPGEEGRKKKTAHMDWHFRVRQRMAEAERRGQYRSLYVAKDDWIKSREEVDVSYSPAENEAAPAEPAAKPPEQLYIPVPDPTSGVNTVCPICQERFENKWLDSAQEWVWLDAKMVGARAFHASCHVEATKDRERGATPDGVLGKRKADGGGENKVKKSRG